MGSNVASADGAEMIERVAGALRNGAFNPQHAGNVFLRADAERAVRAALDGWSDRESGAAVRILVAGKDDAGLRPVSFMGARFQPDLVIETGRNRVAITITLLRSDASPVTEALAGALALGSRYDAVVAFILDRRLAKRNPFDDPSDEPAQSQLSDAEQALVRQLWERQHVHVEVRRQDPFGW